MATAQTVVQFTGEQQTRVRAHLQEILDHSAFAGSRRRQAFLRHIVEEALAGRGHMIKETSIAIDVFDRTSDETAQGASIVRVTGGEVRRRLAQVYSSGLTSGVHIELPVGSYQPLIVFGDVPAKPRVEV